MVILHMTQDTHTLVDFLDNMWLARSPPINTYATVKRLTITPFKELLGMHP